MTLVYNLVLRLIWKEKKSQDLGGNRTHNFKTPVQLVYQLTARWWEVRYLYTSVLGAYMINSLSLS